jgi:hypothetical protein
MSRFKNELFYIKLDKAIQVDLCKMAIEKAGSEKELSFILKIPASTFYFYKKALYSFPLSRFTRLLEFLGIKEADLSYALVDANESRQKGGNAVYSNYLKSGRFLEIHKKMRIASSEYMKDWHKKARQLNAQKYYELQYSRFKKIGGYKIKTNKGHFVRNWLEKEVADILYANKLSYEYEPYTLVNQNVYFPDFICNNIIIECTYWKGKDKAEKLKVKINDFEAAGFEVFVVIPRALRSFYKPIENNLIYLEKLGEHEIFGDKVSKD